MPELPRATIRVALAVSNLVVLIWRAAARNNSARDLPNFFQPMSRPCVFRSKDGESNRYNDERWTRQDEERNADQQHRGPNNRDDDAPDDLDILKIPKTQNPFDPVHVA